MVGTTGYRSPRDIAGALGFNPAYWMRLTRAGYPKYSEQLT